MTRRLFIPVVFVAIISSFVLFACTAISPPAANTSTPLSSPTASFIEETPGLDETPGPNETPKPPDHSSSSNDPVIPETRRLTLEYPLKVRAGNESSIVILTLEVDDLGNITPTAQFAGNVTEGEVIEIPNLYETHNITAEAQFDIAGLEVKPSGATYQPLKQGETVTFYWSIRAQDVGKYRGTVWLYLDFENRTTGEKSRMPVSAQIVEIEAVDFFGFSVNFVRTSGLVGSVLGVIVGFPFFDDIAKYLWGKLTKKKKKPGKTTRKT